MTSLTPDANEPVNAPLIPAPSNAPAAKPATPPTIEPNAMSPIKDHLEFPA